MNKYVLMFFIITSIFSCNRNPSEPVQGLVKDIDGNIYNYVTIGSQVWMVENLKTTRYRNGDSIPNVPDSLVWYSYSKGAYCDFENKSWYADTYGRLYNLYAVKDGRGLAPDGWHVATDTEWTTLTTYLGGENLSGGKLKEGGFTHWVTPNLEATNATKFTALPGGGRFYYFSAFSSIGYYGYWWSPSGDFAYVDYYRSMSYWSGDVTKGTFGSQYGFSVRCIKDN